VAAVDKQRIEVFLRRGVRLNLYSADDPTVLSQWSQCAADADDTLFTVFRAVLANDHHVYSATYYRTAPLTATVRRLRPRRHDCSLTIKADSRNFIFSLATLSETSENRHPRNFPTRRGLVFNRTFNCYSNFFEVPPKTNRGRKTQNLHHFSCQVPYI